MANFKPSVHFNLDDETLSFERRNGRYGSTYEKTFQEFSTYRELIKSIPNFKTDKFTVFRSRRGEWGEWFEKWEQGKIVEEGWM